METKDLDADAKAEAYENVKRMIEEVKLPVPPQKEAQKKKETEAAGK